MRLKNKKTGQLGNFSINKEDYFECVDLDYVPQYRNLAELNEEWEDYEEPKEYWYIDDAGVIQIDQVLSSEINMRKSIGNYFETEEEAEKAVEKLKAWKRLRDKGFRFTAWYGGSKNISYEITSLENETYIPRQICDDLDLLFGGEE